MKCVAVVAAAQFARLIRIAQKANFALVVDSVGPGMQKRPARSTRTALPGDATMGCAHLSVDVRRIRSASRANSAVWTDHAFPNAVPHSIALQTKYVTTVAVWSEARAPKIWTVAPMVNALTVSVG